MKAQKPPSTTRPSEKHPTDATNGPTKRELSQLDRETLEHAKSFMNRHLAMFKKLAKL